MVRERENLVGYPVCVCDKNQVEIGQVINMMRGQQYLSIFPHPCLLIIRIIRIVLPDDPHIGPKGRLTVCLNRIHAYL